MICNKTNYKTKQKVIADLKRIVLNSTRKTKPCRYYLCECGNYHLTSKISLIRYENNKY